MSSRRHRSYARSRTHCRPCSVQLEGSSCHLWKPPPGDDPIIIAGIGDAIELVFELFEMPMQNAALLMFDQSRQLLGVLLDPPAGFEFVTDWARRPGVNIDFCQTILVVVDNDLDDGPVPQQALQFYDVLREVSLRANIVVIDVIFANPDRVRSMAFATGDHGVWTSQFPRAS